MNGWDQLHASYTNAGLVLNPFISGQLSTNCIGPRFCETNKYIVVNGLKACLQYLRCLCSSISAIKISYIDWHNYQCEYVHQCINQYCAESLVNILFFDKLTLSSFTHFEKPFVNVHTVSVFVGNLTNQLKQCPQWFRNVQRLELKMVHMNDCRKIRFPRPLFEIVESDFNLLWCFVPSIFSVPEFSAVRTYVG